MKVLQIPHDAPPSESEVATEDLATLHPVPCGSVGMLWIQPGAKSYNPLLTLLMRLFASPGDIETLVNPETSEFDGSAILTGREGDGTPTDVTPKGVETVNRYVNFLRMHADPQTTRSNFV